MQDWYRIVQSTPRSTQSRARSVKTGKFSKKFEKLPADIQAQATAAFERWRLDPASVNFKSLDSSNNEIWSAQISHRYRALAKKTRDEAGRSTYVWFWVGSHEDYNQLVKGRRMREQDSPSTSARRPVV